MSDHFRLVVAIPSGPYWNAKFGMDLVNMVAAFSSKRVPGYRSQELRVVNVRSSILSKNRHDAVQQARHFAATHMLFLDTDHTFPPDLPHRLAAHGKRIVAANCVTKTLPATPTARKKAESPAGEVVYTDMDSGGLEEVWRIGTGVMLIKLDVFDTIGNGVWETKYLPEADTYQGEDWAFCEACEKANIPLYIDHNVSRWVGHEGHLVFTHELVGEIAREAV